MRDFASSAGALKRSLFQSGFWVHTQRRADADSKSLSRSLGHGGRHVLGTQQAFEQSIHLAAHFIQAAKGANSALSGA